MVMQPQNLPVLRIGIQEGPHFLFQIMKGRRLFQQLHHLGCHFGITAVGVVHIADGGKQVHPGIAVFNIAVQMQQAFR